MIMTQQHPNQHHPQQQHLMMARATSGGSTEFVRMQQPHSNVSGRNNQQQYWNSNMPQPNGFPPQQLAPMGQMSRYNTANNSFKSNSTSDAVAVSVSNNTMYCMVPPGSIRAPNSGQPTPPPGSVVTSQSPRMHGTQFQMVPRDGMQSPSQANFMPTNQSPVAVSTAAQYSMNTWDYQNQQQASQHNQAANQHIMQSSPNHPPGAVSNTQQMQATSHFPNSGDSSSQSGQVAAQQVKMFGQSGGGGAGAPANSGGENKSLLQQLLCENPG